MLIAQITDLHVVARGRLCQGRVPTNQHVREAVRHINALDPPADVVIATGDLTDHGSAEEYAELRALLAELRAPLYPVPGNHDHRDRFLEAFADRPCLPRPGARFAHYVVDDHPVRLVGLDTTVAGEHYGLMCDERLAWLDGALGAMPRRPTMLFMHHPPFRTGIRWLDAAGLYGGRKMAEVVARHRHVERVACGHIHRPIQAAWAGTVAATAPSTSHAQVALDLTEASGFDFTYAVEPRGIQLYLHDPEYGILSHFSYVTGVEDRFASVNAARLRDAFRSRYDDLCRTEFDARPG